MAEPAARTEYVASPPLPGMEALPLPQATRDLEQAKADMSTHGVCIVEDALSPDLLARLREKLDRQAAAEAEAFGATKSGKVNLSSLVNKGAVFLELAEHPVVDELMGNLFGRNFLLHSLTGSYFTGSSRSPQVLHRDQGQLPASVDIPAACVMFWCLDVSRRPSVSFCLATTQSGSRLCRPVAQDFTPENGGT